MGRRKPPEFLDHPLKFGSEMVDGWGQTRVYRAFCTHVVDGDTYDFLIDFGFQTYGYHAIRLRGVNTPEINRGDDAERLLGLEAKHFVEGLIWMKPCVLTSQRDKTTFGRYVADVFFWDGTQFQELAGQIINAGFAKF